MIQQGRELDAPFSVLEAVASVNDKPKSCLVEKIGQHLGSVSNWKIGAWSLAFKLGTDYVRKSAAFRVVKNLVDMGGNVVAHDPQARENFQRAFGDHPKLTYLENAYEGAPGSDALVLVTEWPEYKRPNWTKLKGLMKNLGIFDGRNQYDFDRVKECGFHYECIGRPDSMVSPAAPIRRSTQ